MSKARGKAINGTATVQRPAHPSRKQIIIVPPIKARGNMLPAIKNGSLFSMELKSLLSKLITFPTSAELATKLVNFDTFAKSNRIRPARILLDMIGLQ
jgi:hypothetical protein